MIALLFPGQGSQTTGMGADLARISPAAAEVFERAEAILDLPLRQLCFEGPDEALRPTEIAQPALFVAGYAAWLAAKDQLGKVGAVAGHSLGEYTALAVAGALEFEPALRLVRRRGELMRDAAAARPGAMAAVLKLDDATVNRLCAEIDGLVVPANYNSPGQVVVSGEEPAIDALLERVKAARGRAVKLPVSGAFHSPLMQSAADALAAELDGVEFQEARVPVVQNVTAEPVIAAPDLRRNLAAQVTGSVRWTASVETLAMMGVTRAVELGPGNVLTGLVRRTDDAIAVHNVADGDGLQGLAGFLEEGVGE